jgi:hypothetical protein
MSSEVRRSDRVRSAVAVSGAFLVVLALGTLGWALTRPGASDTTAQWQAAAADASGRPTATPTPTPVVIPTTKPPTPTPSKTVKPTKKVIPKPTATVTVPLADQPPEQKPKPNPPAGCEPTYSGPKASMADVKAALVTAAKRQYYVGVIPPSNLTVPLPNLEVPADLIKALAWQESGWQSTILACDGGIGTMQVQPETVDHVNLRFGEDFDAYTLSGNASVGAAYIQWLTMYFGIKYYSQNFDLSSVAAVGVGGAPLQLLDVVLAAYNVGPGTLEVAPNTLAINSKGQAYANNVKALRTSCTCLSF